ncbi:MAG TPA: Uma2 family endonuclease [Rubrobacter sp.]|nr:Uma2 family endonuclease [Rubrobacter sp.]
METIKTPSEQRTVLHNISWETYEHLLADHRDSSSPRFAYDRGALEIMSPNPEHERTNRRIAQLVLAVADEVRIAAEDLGSTTFRREELERGFEPDSCFYIQNEGLIRGKNRIDLAVDPPPDLVIEVDITSPSLNKFPIYARLGVPEVWRYDGSRITIFTLKNTGYTEAPRSTALPPVTGEVLSRFVEESKTLERTAWTRKVRNWARERSG